MKRQLLVALLCATAMTTAACGKTVPAGSAGVKIKNIGTGAGVQPDALGVGWHPLGIAEDIDLYPTISKTYSFTHESTVDSPTNEEMVFTDRQGLPMTADVAVTLQVEFKAAPRIYNKWRLEFPELLAGPIRNDIRSAIAAETELVAVDQLLAGGRQAVLQRALRVVQKKWAREGVMITQLEWVGTIRFPDVVTASIRARAKADQDVLAANASVAVAEAKAREKVAIAQGDADSYRIRGEALRANPQVLQQQAIIKWNGALPQVMSGNATPFVTLH